MKAIDYASFGDARLREFLDSLQRSERDFEQRIATRAAQRAAAPRVVAPDPVAKRLAWLLAETRNRRVGIERELAARGVERPAPTPSEEAASDPRAARSSPWADSAAA